MSSLSPLLSTYQLWNKKDSVRIFLKKGEELIHKIPGNSPTALEFYKPAFIIGLENIRKVSAY